MKQRAARTFAVILASSLTLLATASVANASPACDHMNRVYSQCGHDFKYDGKNFFFKVGAETHRVDCSDGRKLDYFTRLDQMDVESTFMFYYKPGPIPLPENRKNWDPGRLRVEPLLKAVYGADEASMRKNLVKIQFLGQTISFNKNLGAANALAKAGRELDALVAKDPAIAKFLAPFLSKKEDLRNYAVSYRVVAGTQRLSSHSYGTGLDILTNKGPQYWLWDEKKANPEKAKLGEIAYKDDHYHPPGEPIFPMKIVEIMEQNGFIWGGKWNHYDTMHFEYRPEFFKGYKADCPQKTL